MTRHGSTETHRAPTAELDRPAPKDWSDEQGVALGLWTSLSRCHATSTKAIGETARKAGLNAAELRALEVLQRSGVLRLADLAEQLLVSAAHATYVMDRLEEKGLAARRPPSGDRRVVLAELTKKGRAVVSGLAPVHRAHLETLARHLTAHEQRTMHRLLEKLATGIAAATAAGA